MNNLTSIIIVVVLGWLTLSVTVPVWVAVYLGWKAFTGRGADTVTSEQIDELCNLADDLYKQVATLDAWRWN